MLVQSLLPESAVERFNEGTVLGPARPAEVQRHLVPVRPSAHRQRSKLGAVVRPDAARCVPLPDDGLEHLLHVVSLQADSLALCCQKLYWGLLSGFVPGSGAAIVPFRGIVSSFLFTAGVPLRALWELAAYALHFGWMMVLPKARLTGRMLPAESQLAIALNRSGGRPPIPDEMQQLIRRLSRDNPL